MESCRRERYVKRGYFIVLEGPDGSGKSTQALLLAERLEQDGYRCVVTGQPGGTEEGRRIRDLLLDPKLHIDPKAELFLFLADRANHVSRVVQPALAENKVVISSRYFYSTLVYQGLVRQVAPYDFLLQMNLFSVSQVIPDLVFYLDVDAADGLNRARLSSQEEMNYAQGDRIEREGVDFQHKVRAGYHELASRHGELFVPIDTGHMSREEIGRIVYAHLKGRMNRD
jgi:dTMP kinase